MYNYSFRRITFRVTEKTMHVEPLEQQDATPHTTAPRVAIAGATGYAGQELVRLLARHPRAR